MRLSLAIPVFVRGVNGQGKEFLEFCTLLKRKCRRSAACDAQTLAAPVADIAGNAFCSHSKKCEASTNDAYAEGARGSSLADRWLESVWITICPATYLEQAKKGIDIPFNLF